MERVAFLIERTEERIACLLNPETLTVRRLAGLSRRSAATGPLHAAGLSDDPLLYTGGGTTELTLDLLFDTTLVTGPSALPIEDVRMLTRPLWDLAENRVDDLGRGLPPIVRFVWGCAWNVPGVIDAVAERLESFTEGGVPRRSWLRMRFLRVTTEPEEMTLPPIDAEMLLAMRPELEIPETPPAAEPPAGEPADHAVGMVTGATAAMISPTRLDDLADRHFGDARLWRLIAWYNDVADPFRLATGQVLRIPPGGAAGAPARTGMEP